MDIEIKIDTALKKLKVLILTPRITDEVRAVSEILQNTDTDILTGFKNDMVTILDPSTVTRIYSSNQKVYAVCEEGEFIIKKRLYHLEDMLKAHRFVRISNSEIINMSKVKSFDLSLSGTICVIFGDGTSTYVSRRYISKIKNFLGI